MGSKFDKSKRSKKVKEEEKKWAERVFYKGGCTQLKERASLIQFFQFRSSSQSKCKSSTSLLPQCRLNPLFYFNQYIFKHLTLSFQAILRFCAFPRGESKLSLPTQTNLLKIDQKRKKQQIQSRKFISSRKKGPIAKGGEKQIREIVNRNIPSKALTRTRDCLIDKKKRVLESKAAFRLRKLELEKEERESKWVASIWREEQKQLHAESFLN
jgi:hypothetical protein